MKIAFVHGNFWPYVRRGAERLTFELATYFTQRGHTVDVITTKPGPGRIAHYGDVRVLYQRQLRHPLTQGWRAGYLYNYLFGLTACVPIVREHYDVVHCWFYTYSPAGVLSRNLYGSRYIYHNILSNPHFGHPVDRAWFRWALANASQVATLSQIGAEELRRDHGIDAAVVPPPVNLDRFHICEGKDPSTPRILFASSLTDPQKGLPFLLRAFNYVHKACPIATLQIAGPEEWFHVPDGLWTLLEPGAREHVQVLGTGTLDGLADLYAEAAVTVLPSWREPFGMVLIESLAAGTPVVSTTGGGPEEIITPEVGALVTLDNKDQMKSDAKARELADALLYAIELGRQPGIAQRCRAHAANWSVETIGARMEELYHA